MRKSVGKIVKFGIGFDVADKKHIVESIDKVFQFYPSELLEFAKEEGMQIFIGKRAPIQLKVFLLILAIFVIKGSLMDKYRFYRRETDFYKDVHGSLHIGPFRFKEFWNVRRENPDKAGFLFVHKQESVEEYEKVISHEVGHLYDYYLSKLHPTAGASAYQAPLYSTLNIHLDEKWSGLYQIELSGLIRRAYPAEEMMSDYLTSCVEEITAELLSIAYRYESQQLDVREKDALLLNDFKQSFFAKVKKYK